MTSRDFCFWLQGYFEITQMDHSLNHKQVEVIRRHLAMVFVHEIDPSMPNPKLDSFHASGSPPVMRC